MTKAQTPAYRAGVAAVAVAAAGGLAAHRWHVALMRKRLSEGVLRGPRPRTAATTTDSSSASSPSTMHGTLSSSSSSSSSAGPAPRVDARFIRELAHFLRIAVPSVASREFAAVVAVAALLGARSWLDLWASDNGGRVVKAIVGRDRPMFIQTAVIDIGRMMFPMALVNNSLRYMLSRLTIMMRRRLSLYFHDKYLSSNTFYKVSNLDTRIRNIDQHLTVDIDRFCTSLADLYSNITKPSIDIFLFSRRLARSLGPQGPLLMISYFGLCSIILQCVQPPFGSLAAEEQKLEGEYRLHHSRLIAHSEEIAFFGGGSREKLYINHAFDNVVSHLRRLFAARWRIGVIDAILVKYIATIVGYSVVSIPVFFSNTRLFRALSPSILGRAFTGTPKETTSPSEIAGLYTRNSRLLLQLAGAIGRLVLAGKQINHMTGYCQRVTKLRDVLNELSERNAVQKKFESSHDLAHDAHLSELMRPGKTIVANDYDSADCSNDANSTIRLDNVNLVSPDATVLVEGLTFEIRRGEHVLTTGPNGSGKSSLFRVLAGLWPLYGGTMRRPGRHRIFYVPQRPYLALGTLRENISYPMTWQEAVEERGATDEDMHKLLELAHLSAVAARLGGLDAVRDWADCLSGGQKQRLGFARLLFHKPHYAILDEASSAVSIDIEELLYKEVKNAGITLISVSHRPSLWAFHDKVLAFDGNGGYDFRNIEPEDVPPSVVVASTVSSSRTAVGSASGFAQDE